MPTIEVSLPDRIDSEVNRLVEQGEFINREQAIEELLSRGMSAYETTEESTREPGEDMFEQAEDERRDPAMRDDDEEGYTL